MLLPKILPFLFCLLCCNSILSAQTSGLQLAAQTQLQQRGISEDELREKLIQKGVAVDDLDAEQVLRLQPLIEQAVKELEQEKGRNTNRNLGAPEPPKPQSKPVLNISSDLSKSQIADGADTTAREARSEVRKLAAKSSVEIAKKVKEGATVEEAISESLTNQTDEISEAKTKIYGQELFRNKSIDVYRSTKDAKPPDNYILGIGDELTVIIFGASQGDFRYEINDEGYISPQGMGKIFLKGVPYGKAKELVRNRFDRNFLFRSDQFVMHLATARTVSVNIFGEVANPGTFAISSINTAFNALAAAGGPNDIGSVRNIQVTKSGKTKELDVYAFMQDGSLQYDFYLDNNDVIHVPVAEKMISIQGAVNRPAIYELKGSETLDDLIKFSGGLLAGAYRNSILVKRVIGKRSVVQEVDLDKQTNFALQNGDVVSVKQISEAASNTITVEGEVEFPGVFALDEYTDLASLVFKTTPKRTARTDMAFIFRKNLDGKVQILQVNLDEAIKGSGQPLRLQAADRLFIFKQDRFVDQAEVQIIGAVREPKTQSYGQDSRLAEYLQLSGGLRDDAFDTGYIIRSNPKDKRKEYIKIQPQKAIANPNSQENILLKPFDEVRILSQSDFIDSAYVRVSGAINKPKELPYGQALTLADAVRLTGGLRLEAKKGRIDIFRLEIDKREKSRSLQTTIEIVDENSIEQADFMLHPYDEVVIRAVPEFSMLKKVRIQGEVRYPGEYAILQENERISDLVKKAGGLTAEAYAAGGSMHRQQSDGLGIVATRMDQAIKQPKSYTDLILQDGDEITIPKCLDLVDIFTENTEAALVIGDPLLKRTNKISAAYRPGKRAKWYVKEYAGGVGKYSRVKLLRVHYPNGRVKKTKSFLLFSFTPKLVPGSKIILPTDQDKLESTKPKEPKKPVDWDKAFTQSLSLLSAAATVILAMTAINR